MTVGKMPTEEEILDLTHRLESAPAEVSSLSDGALRARLLAAARNLVAALEKPETELMNIAKAVCEFRPSVASFYFTFFLLFLISPDICACLST
jgi:hypothetical protein